MRAREKCRVELLGQSVVTQLGYLLAKDARCQALLAEMTQQVKANVLPPRVAAARIIHQYMEARGGSTAS